MPEHMLLRFVHITDTHISADPHYNMPGASHTPMVGAQALVNKLKHLPFQPDFVLHTGDVAYEPDDSAYAAAKDILGQIPYPVHYLPGNHDSVTGLQRHLLGIADPREAYDTEFEVNGVQVITVDSNRPAEPPRGRVSDAQLAWLEARCKADDPRPLIVAVHHNVLKVGIPWWDDHMSLENGEEFHAALLPARNRLRGVFFGHVHQDTETYRDGILYSSALSSWYQIHASPGQIDTEPDRYAGPGFSVVTVTATTTFIRRHRFTVDAGSLEE
ncbi:MAG: metallophosphoesterase [Chloroflexi bacterium]|nr:metallophosphoesterase [Chloroflexota bacterium]